jgi:hypothetical protein
MPLKIKIIYKLLEDNDKSKFKNLPEEMLELKDQLDFEIPEVIIKKFVLPL